MKHAFRDLETPNADAARTRLNMHLGAKSSKEAFAKFKARLPDKIRKNAVLAIEHLVTASPEWFQDKTIKQQNAFFSDALNYIKSEFGGAENMIYAGIHRDESTPHMYCYVVPIDHETGKLNARKYLGGSKQRMVDLQSGIAEKVGARHGLERGQRKSKARHKSIKSFYNDLKEIEKLKEGDVIEPSAMDHLLEIVGIETEKMKKLKASNKLLTTLKTAASKKLKALTKSNKRAEAAEKYQLDKAAEHEKVISESNKIKDMFFQAKKSEKFVNDKVKKAIEPEKKRADKLEYDLSHSHEKIKQLEKQLEIKQRELQQADNIIYELENDLGGPKHQR